MRGLSFLIGQFLSEARAVAMVRATFFDADWRRRTGLCVSSAYFLATVFCLYCKTLTIRIRAMAQRCYLYKSGPVGVGALKALVLREARSITSATWLVSRGDMATIGSAFKKPAHKRYPGTARGSAAAMAEAIPWSGVGYLL
jgi:hypothetical protein